MLTEILKPPFVHKLMVFNILVFIVPNMAIILFTGEYDVGMKGIPMIIPAMEYIYNSVRVLYAVKTLVLSMLLWIFSVMEYIYSNIYVLYSMRALALIMLLLVFAGLFYESWQTSKGGEKCLSQEVEAN